MSRKLAIVGTVGLPAHYGGWETLVNYLCLNLSKKYEITVFCSAKKYEDKLDEYNGAKLAYVNLNANGIQSIPYDVISMYKAVHFADLVLVLGVSGCIALPLFKLFSHKKFIVNIDGLEWKRQKWGWFAKLFLKASEWAAVKFADEVIADNAAIKKYLNDGYKKSSTYIPYGANHVQSKALTNDVLKRFPYLIKDYAFKVARIEPENNMHLILGVFSENKSIDLVIIGNWNNSEYGINLKESYSSFDHIHLIDAIYDLNVLDQIRSNCKVYIHGHSAGGTNPSLVEAMYLGLPVIAYKVSYNRETTNNQALYFSSAEELAGILETLDDKRLQDIADNMKSIASERYIWSEISTKYAKVMFD